MLKRDTISNHSTPSETLCVASKLLNSNFFITFAYDKRRKEGACRAADRQRACLPIKLSVFNEPSRLDNGCRYCSVRCCGIRYAGVVCFVCENVSFSEKRKENLLVMRILCNFAGKQYRI